MLKRAVMTNSKNLQRRQALVGILSRIATSWICIDQTVDRRGEEAEAGGTESKDG